MKLKIFMVLFLMGVGFYNLNAQDAWTLQQCLDHALENNLSLKLQNLDVQDKDYQLSDARNQRLPSLNADINFGESFNQSGSANNVYVKGNSFNAGFNLSAGVPLFNGFAIKNRILRARTNMEAAEYDFETRKNDVMLLLLQSYLDILLKKEFVLIAEQQLAITLEEKKTVQIKYDVGQISKDVYLENLALEARESALLEDAKNNLTISKLVLAHILDLEEPETFDVVVLQLPELMAKVSLYSSAELFSELRQKWPEIKSAQKYLESSAYTIEEARSGFYPSVSAFAGYSAGYYNFHQGDNPSLVDQLEITSRPTIGVGVRIPLFNKFSNKTNLRRAELNYNARGLELELVENRLRETIKEAYVSALAAHSRYESAMKSYDATNESFRFAEEKYKVGSLSPYDYSTAKSQLMKAESELLQAKYQFVFSTRVLDFYKNNTITL